MNYKFLSSLMFYAFNSHVALKAHRHQVKHWGKQRKIAIRSGYGFCFGFSNYCESRLFEWIFFLELYLVGKIPKKTFQVEIIKQFLSLINISISCLFESEILKLTRSS